ncbi:MAG: hypothetical protein Kapaf2KO_17150 [Candidatus Kapaibacteriales bacterium]
MENISSIASLEGRAKLRELYQKERFTEYKSGFGTLLSTFRVATGFDSLERHFPKSSIVHKAGLGLGIKVWMEEIVGRYYYSSASSLVYFGAAVLLVIIGLTRFRSDIDDNWVIVGIVFEATLLLLVFIVMYFSPSEEEELVKPESDDYGKELLDEVGEIGRDLASVAIQFERISKSLESHAEQITASNIHLNQIAEGLKAVSAPNPKMLEAMDHTASKIESLSKSVEVLEEQLKKYKSIAVENEVKLELEKIFKTGFEKSQK